MKHCCICDRQIYIGYAYFCKKHWVKYKDSLDEPWIKYLVASEQRERENFRKTSSNVSLHKLVDIEDTGEH